MRGLLAGVCALLLASGCSADEPPSTLPPLTASPSPTASPTPTGIHEATPEGANAFTRCWFAELNAAFTSRDSSRLRLLSASDCDVCNNFAAAIDELARTDQRVSGGGITLLFVEVAPLEADGAIVEIAYRRAASTRLDAQQRPVATGAPTPRQLAQVKLVRAASGWRFDALRLVKL
jgi:hypothetical protein